MIRIGANRRSVTSDELPQPDMPTTPQSTGQEGFDAAPTNPSPPLSRLYHSAETVTGGFSDANTLASPAAWRSIRVPSNRFSNPILPTEFELSDLNAEDTQDRSPTPKRHSRTHLVSPAQSRPQGSDTMIPESTVTPKRGTLLEQAQAADFLELGTFMVRRCRTNSLTP
jgi:hypothetical protein